MFPNDVFLYSLSSHSITKHILDNRQSSGMSRDNALFALFMLFALFVLLAYIHYSADKRGLA
jgi:hypothetical protein